MTVYRPAVATCSICEDKIRRDAKFYPHRCRDGVLDKIELKQTKHVQHIRYGSSSSSIVHERRTQGCMEKEKSPRDGEKVVKQVGLKPAVKERGRDG